MTALELRDYQVKALDAIDTAEREGVRRPLVVHPTGTGKTVTFAAAIERRAEKGRSIVLVHREELADQAIEKLSWQAPGLRTGKVKAEENNIYADVVVASVPTIQRDARMASLLAGIQTAGSFGTIIADEAHHAPSPSWTKVMTALGAYHPYGPLAVGFTATPERDGKTLGVWEKVVSYMSIREAIFRDFLVPILPAVVIETKTDMRRIRKGGDGDLSGGDLGRAMEAAGAIDQIADGLIEHASDRKILAFMPSVATAHQLAAALLKRGMSAEAVDGETETELRTGIKYRLKTGKTQCVVNCGVFTEGFDEPSIDCVMIGRATTFHGLYVQMAGRGTRKSPGKTNLLIIDVVGATKRHDLVARVDLGDDMDSKPGQVVNPTGPRVCKVCDEACEEAEHRCALCLRYLPVGRIEDGETRHENCHAGAGAKVDVFGASRLRWLPVHNTGKTVKGWCLGAGSEVVLMVPNGFDTWKVASYADNRIEIIHDEVPSDWAMGIGEDRAKAFLPLVERGKSWLRQPVTDALRNRLEREGLPAVQIPKVKTKGQASELITRIQARRALNKLVA